jgi:hypothetical protein
MTAGLSYLSGRFNPAGKYTSVVLCFVYGSPVKNNYRLPPGHVASHFRNSIRNGQGYKLFRCVDPQKWLTCVVFLFYKMVRDQVVFSSLSGIKKAPHFLLRGFVNMFRFFALKISEDN